MKKLLKTLAFSAAVALAGASAHADGLLAGTGAFVIGGNSYDCTGWSTSGGADATDLGVLDDLTISGIQFDFWSDNSHGGANMYFELWDDSGTRLGSLDSGDGLWLGAASYIGGDWNHDYRISWSGSLDASFGTIDSLVEGETYYLTMWFKTYGGGDVWYPGDNGKFQTRFVYGKPQKFVYNVNDGGTGEASCAVPELTLLVGSTYQGAVQAVWANHWFKGWWTDLTGGTRYQNGKSVVPDNGGEPIQLYAHWTGEQVITFNLNGGDYCAKDSMTRPVGDVYWGLPSAPTRAGYKFDGWYTQADGGTRVKNGDPVTSADPLTLYAHWTGLQVVTLDANGGTCAKESITRPVGNVYWGLPSAPTKDGCKFLGWFTDPENGTRVRNGDPVTSAEPMTLYAHWKVRAAPLAITGFSISPRATPRAGTATLPVDEEYTATQSWTALTGFSGNGVGTYADGRCKFDSNNDWLMVQFDSAPGTLTFDVKGNSSSSGTAPGSFLVEESADGSDWDTVTNLPSSSFDASDYTTFGPYTLDSASRYVRWTYAQKYNFNLGLNNVHITAGSASEPTVTVLASEETIEEDQSVSITASAEGFSDNDSVNWVWYVGATQQAETSDTLVLNDLTMGEYQVTAWGYLGDDLDTATEKDDDTVTITVNPASVWYNIFVDDQIENGTIEADMLMAQDGDTVTLTAHPDSGYALDKFYLDGEELPGNTFEIQGADVTVSATFVVKTSYTATYTVTGKYAVTASGDVPDGSSATYSQTYNTVSQATKGNSFSLTLKGYEGLKIVGLTLSMHSNGSTGAGSLSVTSGDATIASIADAGFGDESWHGSYINTYVDVTPAVTQTVVDDDVIFLISASSNSLFCQSYTVEYEFVPVEPSVTLSPSGDLEVYVNDVVTVTATAHDFSGEVEWTWYVDNSPVAGATTATFTLDTSVVDIYEVTAMANYGNDEMAESDPLTVTVKAPSEPHAVTIVTDDNGTVTADPNPAMEGVTVTLTAVPNEGYRLDYVESDEVTITDMSFVMPDKVIGVYAYFEGKHDVVIDDEIVNGSVVASPATAFSDETVTLTVQPDAGYKLDTLTVLDEDLNEIPVTDLSFVMPKGDAYVFATFVELPDLYFQFETSESWTGYGDATIPFVNTGSTAEDIPSVTFNTSRTLRGTGSTDKKVGSASIRMAPLSGSDAVVANAAAFEQAIGKVAFQYAKYGTDSFDSFTVQVSADGETWSDLATQPETPTTSLQTYVNENVPEGMKFIRFVTTNSGSSNDHRFNIDEIQIWFADVPMQTFLYDVNDGDTGEASCTVLELSLPIGSTYEGAVQAVWANHWFKGWWTDPTGGTRYQNGKSVVPDNGGEPIQLYAHWTGEKVITLDATGGTCSKDSITRPVGDVYWGLPSAPTKDGCKFLGWYTAETGGTRVRNGDTVNADDPTTLYAQWKQRTSPLAITGFSVAPRTAAPAARSAAGDTIECTLWVNTIATIDYEIFWTDDLRGEWTLVKRWTAEADGEPVTVAIPADSTTGFFRIVELDVE